MKHRKEEAILYKHEKGKHKSLEGKYQDIQLAARRNPREFQQRKAMGEDWSAGQGSSENCLGRRKQWAGVSAVGDKKTWSGNRVMPASVPMALTLCQALC